MKILFISISMPDLSTGSGSFYADIVKELVSQGHDVTVMAPALKGGHVGVRQEGLMKVLRVKTGEVIGNIPFWKKGMNILLMTRQYKAGYQKHLAKTPFDIVIMPTPPSTLVDVVENVKKQTSAKFYLLLRDIHPECLDRKVIPQRFLERTDVYDECKRPYGVNLLAYRLLYVKSQKLYRLADCIGCMSPGNMEYVKQIAPFVTDNQLTLLPNWYKGAEMDGEDTSAVREKYGLTGKFVAIFGGTIGEAQAVWNIAQLAKMNLSKKDVVFLIVGRGVKKQVLEDIAKQDGLDNMQFLNYMSREDYEAILQTADLGLISLDEKYTVPTCPSKIIGYMALGKPVLALINKGSDYGEYYIDRAKCGLWSDDLNYTKAQEQFEWFYRHPEERKDMGFSGFRFYKEHLDVSVVGKQLSEQLLSLTKR